MPRWGACSSNGWKKECCNGHYCNVQNAYYGQCLEIKQKLRSVCKLPGTDGSCQASQGYSECGQLKQSHAPSENDDDDDDDDYDDNKKDKKKASSWKMIGKGCCRYANGKNPEGSQTGNCRGSQCTGSKIAEFKQKKIHSCREQCEKDARCKYFEFSANRKECELFWAAPPITKVVRSRSCTSKFQCWEKK